MSANCTDVFLASRQSALMILLLQSITLPKKNANVKEFSRQLGVKIKPALVTKKVGTISLVVNGTRIPVEVNVLTVTMSEMGPTVPTE
jgi:hypothetical protein